MKLLINKALVPDARRMLDQLMEKAAAYKGSLSYTVREGPQQTVIYLGDCDDYGHQEIFHDKADTVEIDIQCDGGVIKAGGWTLLAKIEHGEKGNIVTMLGGGKAKPEWYKTAPCCDHCHTNRFRNTTYIVKKEDGTILQVGSKCLKDYTGIDPVSILGWAKVKSEVDLNAVSRTIHHAPIRMYDVVIILAHACDAVDAFGYVHEYYSTPQNPGTQSWVIRQLASGAQPSVKGLERAASICSWLISLDQIAQDQIAAHNAAKAKFEETGAPEDYAALRAARVTVPTLERRCIPFALSGFVKCNKVKDIVKIPLAYERYLNRKTKGRVV